MSVLPSTIFFIYFFFLVSAHPFCHVRQDSWTNCKLNRANLASGSYLGTHLQYDHIFWDIFPIYEELGTISSNMWYLELTFEDFDIGCKMGSTFRISHLTTTEEDVCNLNRPVGTVRSSGLRVKLQYRSSLRLNVLPEGFIMSYQRVDVPIPIAGQWLWQFTGARKFAFICFPITRHYGAHFGKDAYPVTQSDRFLNIINYSIVPKVSRRV